MNGLQRHLLAWYRSQRRDLPWRHERDPYRVLVAEVMAQQTQAERVGDRHRRFLERFPTPSALAAAPLQAVLDEWRGLGYNLRARRLRDAARIIATEGWPDREDGLRRLPGVGPYTAAALACFAFGHHVAVVDTNVRRVLSRWAGAPLAGIRLRQAADEALVRPAGDWNQAVMDLGALVCTPRRPRCERCPVADWCGGPAAYEAPPPQGRFAGSLRQVRGEVVRALTGGPATAHDLAAATGASPYRLGQALRGLERDGLVVAGERYRIAD